MYETFGPQLKECKNEKQMPLKCLLLKDNATAHPNDINDDLPHGFDIIKVKGVQCYELFGGIALKNHTLSFFFHFHQSEISTP